MFSTIYSVEFWAGFSVGISVIALIITFAKR